MPVNNTSLGYYLERFSKLHTDRTGGWTEATRGCAPHKPLLLLSVLDLFAQGSLTANLVELKPELVDLFGIYWSKVMPPERRGNIFLPFYHLKTDGFWHLQPVPGKEAALAAIRQIGSLRQLREMVLGARLDEDLYQICQVTESRDALRTVLIQTYFSESLHNELLAQGEVNLQSFIYSQQLIEQARKRLQDTAGADDEYRVPARDQGFRQAVVRIYEHRCAFCGMRMTTPDGHTVVTAAHIIPWSISHNDDLHNGMALCRLCHWTFDEGLMGVSNNYQILLSPELRTYTNMPGHLVTLDQRPIIGPAEQDLWPAQESLSWHRHQTFIG